MSYKIEVTGYEVQDDSLTVKVSTGEGFNQWEDKIPAFLMPIIAKKAVEACVEIPDDLVGQVFYVGE